MSHTQIPTPEKTTRLFSVQPFGEAKTTGTPITNKKDTAMNAKRVNWKIRVIIKELKSFDKNLIYFANKSFLSWMDSLKTSLLKIKTFIFNKNGF